MPTPPTNAPLPEGLLIGGYRIVRKIASGGFSFVYLAEDEQGARVAIKEYLPGTLARRAEGEWVPRIDPEHLITYRNGLKCFFEEGRALARVNHPNVVRVLNFFRAHETVYMVMAYEEGRSLQEWILRHRRRPGQEVLPERGLRKVFAQLCHGLRQVHAHRLLHLDIKPANIYLRRDGSPLLLDFGAARQALNAESSRLFPMFTPGFSAPEVNRRVQPLGPWSDIYGVGASLFACMLGAPPPTPDQRATQDKVPRALDSVERQYSLAIRQLTLACLQLDPLQRPPSVLDVQRALRLPLMQTVESLQSSGEPEVAAGRRTGRARPASPGRTPAQAVAAARSPSGAGGSLAGWWQSLARGRVPGSGQR